MAKSKNLFHVVRKQFFGDVGGNAASNVTREVADAYVTQMQGDGCSYEVVPSDGK